MRRIILGLVASLALTTPALGATLEEQVAELRQQNAALVQRVAQLEARDVQHDTAINDFYVFRQGVKTFLKSWTDQIALDEAEQRRQLRILVDTVGRVNSLWAWRLRSAR